MSIINIGPGCTYYPSTCTTLSPYPITTSLYVCNIPSYYTIRTSSYSDDTSEVDPDVITLLKLKQLKSKEIIRGLRDEIDQLKKEKEENEKEIWYYKNKLDQKISDKVKEEIGKLNPPIIPTNPKDDLPTIEDIAEPVKPEVKHVDAETLIGLEPRETPYQPCIPPPSVLNS